MAKLLDPIALARTQFARDRALDRTTKGLFAVKRARMHVSAFAFLRGSAGVFYQLLRDQPTLARGPGGRAWLTGDLHVQNFGAYRSDDADSGEPRVVFGPNDFDETCIGPVRLDVLRLATSYLLSLAEHALGGSARVDAGRALIAGWVEGAFGARRSAREPAPVTKLVKNVEARTKESMLAAYTRGSPRKRALQRDHRLWSIPRALDRRVRIAFEGYVKHACSVHGAEKDHLEVLDVARRVAGTGSLGAERFAVLARGGERGEWIFDLKEESARSASGLPASGLTGAARVVRGIEIAAPAPPRMLGTTRLGSISMLVRRLSPQEDKLDPSDVATEELDGLAHYVGFLAGKMHRKGAIGSLGRAWTESAQRDLLERAITLAGVHEAAYLAYVAM